MGLTKRHLESLPEEQQNKILGTLNEDDEWVFWAAHDADTKTIYPPTGPDDYPDYGDFER